MSDQPSGNREPSSEADAAADFDRSNYPTCRIKAPFAPEPDATVTIKVTPDQHLFTSDSTRQATAPLRQPAVHVRPAHDVGDQDAYRTPAQLRRSAEFREMIGSDPPTAALKGPASEAADGAAEIDDEPTQVLAAGEDTAVQLTPPTAVDPPPSDAAAVGSETVQLDASMNTALMEANSKTIVETGWRCPECKAPNRHQGEGKNPKVICASCGHKTVLKPELVAPLEAKPGEELPPPTMNLVQGKTFLGKYMLDRFLGRGGMGEVWLGRHPNLDIPVAIKIMSTDLMARNPTYLERFLSEARTAAQMNHPNVVRIYDADHQDGLYFIVLEYMDGGDVLQWARKSGGKLQPRHALSVVIAVAEALQEAAKYNIIHRDIKPENIMLTQDGGIKLADLGIAKRIVGAQEAEHFTFTAMVLGTPAYISPEQALNASEVDSRADVYSLGATFYHLVTGSIPFPAKSPFQMMYKHVKEPLVNPRERNPDLAENINAVICKMMEKDPLDRYQDTADLLTDLCRIRDRDASVMQLQASQLPAPQALLAETHGDLSAILAESINPKPVLESSSIWRMAPVQLAIGAAIASLAVILGVQMAPEPPKTEDGITRQLRNALLQVRRQQKADLRTEPSPVVTPPVQDPPTGPDPTLVTRAAESNAAEMALLAKQQELLALRRQRFDERLAEAEAVWQRVRDAGHDPAHGLEAALLQSEQLLADAKIAAASRQWDAATAHLDKVLSLSLGAETIAKDRDRATTAIAALRDARRGAIGAGAGEVATIADNWKQVEAGFQNLEKAFAGGVFRDVVLRSPELTRQYQHLETQAPALRQRAQAEQAFDKLYAATDLTLLETWAGDELAGVERARRLAAAETIRHAEAAAGFRSAGQLLTQAIALAEKRRDGEKQAVAAEAAAKAQAAAEAAANDKWLTRHAELETLRAEVEAAAADPKLQAVAVLRAQSWKQRLTEAAAAVRKPEDKAYLEAKTKQAEAIMATLSAAPKIGHGWLIPELAMEMVPLEAGKYFRGSAVGAEDERPRHEVVLTQAFWMGKYEVTQRQFRAITGTNPSSLEGKSDLPVDSVTWEQAMSFCRVLNEREGSAGRLPTGYEYRLPTEAEWEYACRAGTATKFSFGDDPGQLAAHGNYCDRSFRGNSPWRDTDHDDRFGKTAPVGSYKPNPWGLHDMHGNVAEWCIDRYARYPKSSVSNPIGSGKRDERVFRGGNWSGAATLCRSAQRSAAASTYVINSLGFRIVLGPAVLLDDASGTSRLINP